MLGSNFKDMVFEKKLGAQFWLDIGLGQDKIMHYFKCWNFLKKENTQESWPADPAKGLDKLPWFCSFMAKSIYVYVG